jgi:hypothetical protein
MMSVAMRTARFSFKEKELARLMTGGNTVQATRIEAENMFDAAGLF